MGKKEWMGKRSAFSSVMQKEPLGEDVVVAGGDKPIECCDPQNVGWNLDKGNCCGGRS